MAHSDSLKVFWFTPMRTASRSTRRIQEILKFSNCGSHYLPNESHKDYVFISNFRNPYSRFVSAFYYMCQKERTTIKKFQEFVENKIWQDKNSEFEQMFRLNLSEIFEQKNIVPQYLVRVENLHEDIMTLWFVKDNISDQLLNRIDNYINQNNFYHQYYPQRASWQEHYDQHTADMIYEFYKKNFELGGYEKDSWKNDTP